MKCKINYMEKLSTNNYKKKEIHHLKIQSTCIKARINNMKIIKIFQKKFLMPKENQNEKCQ